MSSFNENSSAENRGSTNMYHINNRSNNLLFDSAINILERLHNINQHYCTHCRSYGNHLVQNCNHVTLRIFDYELYKKKENLIQSEEEHKLLAFEDFIYKFHIEIINGFYKIHYGTEITTIDVKVKKIMEYFWLPDVYINEWEVFNNNDNNDNQINELGWFIDRLGSRTITENSFIYPSSLTNNDLLNRITMANILMNELVVRENYSNIVIDYITIISNDNIDNDSNINDNIDYDNLPELINTNDPLVQILLETQNQTHFSEDSERKFNIDAQLVVSKEVEIEETECQICYDSKLTNRLVKFNCNHECCASCIIQTMNNTSQYKTLCCAFCRTSITNFTVGSEEDFQILQKRI